MPPLTCWARATVTGHTAVSSEESKCTRSSEPLALSLGREGVDRTAGNGIGTAENRLAEGRHDGVCQLLRPRLGLRPWLAFLRRTLAFALLVRFDMSVRVAAAIAGSAGLIELDRRTSVTQPLAVRQSDLA